MSLDENRFLRNLLTYLQSAPIIDRSPRLRVIRMQNLDIANNLDRYLEQPRPFLAYMAGTLTDGNDGHYYEYEVPFMAVADVAGMTDQPSTGMSLTGGHFGVVEITEWLGTMLTTQNVMDGLRSYSAYYRVLAVRLNATGEISLIRYNEMNSLAGRMQTARFILRAA